MKEPAVRRLLAALCSPLACSTDILEEQIMILSVKNVFHIHYYTFEKDQSQLKIEEKNVHLIISSEFQSFTWLSSTKKLHLNDFSSSFPGRLCLCSHGTLHTFTKLWEEVWSKAFYFVFVINSIFNFIFFFICQKLAHMCPEGVLNWKKTPIFFVDAK